MSHLGIRGLGQFDKLRHYHFLGKYYKIIVAVLSMRWSFYLVFKVHFLVPG